LKKIGAAIDTVKGVFKYKRKEEKLKYDNGNILNQHSLTEENTTLPLKELILKKYFDEKAKIRSEFEMGNQSEFSFGCTNPEHAVVEKSVKNKSLEFKTSEHAVVEISDKNKGLEFKNSEHAVVDLSDNQKINNEDGTPKLRLVIDYKKLNENTISDRNPMQAPSVILSNLGKAKYFSTIDLEYGFHKILMNEPDIQKTSFSINNGKYEFLRMPFGLTNAPRIFQRAMDDILRQQVGKTCHVYMDDIIIFSKTIEQHYNDLIVITKIKVL